MFKASASASSSSSRKFKQTRMEFKGKWNTGPVFDWYNGLKDPRAKLIQAIQIRKVYASGPVPHRFIVLRMCDKLVHRFDRRPDPRYSVDGLILNQAVPSEDSYTREISLEVEEKSSECEIELMLNGQVDLITVIAVCYAISHDDSARDYTFLRHNCFFFSWTITTIVSRHHLPYEVPSLQSVLQRFGSGLEGLTSLLVDEATALFLDLAIDTFGIFRNKALASMPDGVGLTGRVGSMLPTSLLQFLGRRLFKLHLYFRLRSRLTKMVKAELIRGASIVHEAMLSNHVARELLDKHLWMEGTGGAIKEGFNTEIMKILWKCILEAISGGLENDEPVEHLQAQLTNPELNFTWLGRDIAELCTVCSAAVQGGLSAVGQAGQHVEGLSHSDAFNKAWNAAQGNARTAAEKAVKITRREEKPERDAKWAAIWSIWDDCWKEAHDVVQPKSVQTVERVADKVLATATGVVIQEMKESRAKTIQAYVPNKASFPNGWKCLSTRRGRRLEITNAQLQECMQDIIRGNTATASCLDEVRSSMERVWEKARQNLQAPAALLDTMAELGSVVAH